MKTKTLLFVWIKPVKKLLLLLLTFNLLATIEIRAQQQANVWYMPSGIGLDFNSGTPTQLSNGQMFAQISCGTSGLTSGEGEGCASIADASGNLLFYTNGVKVWDKTHAIMPALAVADMMGNPSSAQSGIIVPKPGNTNQYYIFTVPADPGSVYRGTTCGSNTPADGLRYTLIDVTLNSGNGDVVGGTLNTQVTPAGVEVMEMLTAVPHFNGIDYWVICHGRGNSNYYSFLVSAGGVTAAAGSPFAIGYSHPAGGTPVGIIKANSCFNKIAATFYNSGMGIQVVDFSNATGAITTVLKTFNTGFNTITQIYGLEWSPNSAYIYCSELTNNYLDQINYATNVVTYLQSGTGPGGSCNRTCQLQIAPDGNIYVSRHAGWTASNGDVTCVGTITNPNSATPTWNASAYCWTKPVGNLLYVTHGLPQFTKGFVSNVVDFTPVQACVNQVTSFTGTYSGSVTNPITWDFNGDGTTDATNTLTPTYTYTSGSSTGTLYNVTLTVTDATCGYTKSVTQPVTVYDMTPTYTTSGSCPGPITINATGTGTANYEYWDASSGGTLLGSGASYAVSGPYPKNVWIKNASPMTNITAYPGPFLQTFDADPDWTRFDIYQTVTLKSATIRTLGFGTCGGAQTIELRQGASFPGTLVASKAVTLTCNVENIVSLDFTIPPGTNYYLSFAGNPDITRYHQIYSGPWANSFIKIYDNGTGNKSGPFYDWVIWQANPCASRLPVTVDCSLPVTLVDFFAEKNGVKVDIGWITSTEENSDYFIVQRSNDGVNYSDIATVPAAGNSVNTKKYSVIDDIPSYRMNYYRLVQYDVDGKSQSFKIVAVDMTECNITVAPNPFNTSTKVQFSSDLKAKISILDITGREIMVYEKEEEESLLNVGSTLSPGSYILKIVTEYGPRNLMITKE